MFMIIYQVALYTFFSQYVASQEAVGSGDPDILTTVIQHREYQHLTQKSGGMVEILDELEKVIEYVTPFTSLSFFGLHLFKCCS